MDICSATKLWLSFSSKIICVQFPSSKYQWFLNVFVYHVRCVSITNLFRDPTLHEKLKNALCSLFNFAALIPRGKPCDGVN